MLRPESAEVFSASPLRGKFLRPFSVTRFSVRRGHGVSISTRRGRDCVKTLICHGTWLVLFHVISWIAFLGA